MPISRLFSVIAIVSLLHAAAARADDAPSSATGTSTTAVTETAGTAPATMSTSTTSLTASEGAGLKIYMMAMGQADSMLIVGPEKSVLIDCGTATGDDKKDGGTKARLEKRFGHVKERMVEAVGQPHVDDVIVTHFHSDHVGDSADSEHEASGFWWLFAHGVSTTAILDHGDNYPSFGEETHPHKEWVEWLPKWKEAGAWKERRTPKVGDEIPLGGRAKLRVVAVNGNGVLEKAAEKGKIITSDTTPNENDYSIAVVISCGDWEMYSGGDLSGQDVRNHSGGGRTKRHDAYDDVETTIKDKVGNVEVMRVDHHGSGHSSNEAFVQALRPEVELISCGAGNSYKHPDKEVVKRLKEFGPVFVTSGLASDWSGDDGAPKVEGEMTITVAADGSTYVITGKDGEIFRGRSFSAEEKKKGLDHPEMAKSKS